MDIITSLLATVLGGVIVHYIVKWLDEIGRASWRERV